MKKTQTSRPSRAPAERQPRKEVPTQDAAKLEEIQDRFKDAAERLETMHKEGTIDMRFVDGDTLDPKERTLRNNTKRPWFDLDEINQYENQVINDILANKRAVKFSPRGNGANDDTARFYADKMREVEYRSKAATIAYPMALKNCVWRGFGYTRLKTKYKSVVPTQQNDAYDPSAFLQDLWIEQVPDPNTILPDPAFQMPDLSDIEYLYVLEQLTQSEFTRRFPHAAIKNFSNTVIANSKGWITNKGVQVAEYWYIEKQTTFTLVLLEDRDGNAAVKTKDEVKKYGLADGWEAKAERTVEEPLVRQCLTNGVELLEENEWPGLYIPFAGCFGKMFWRDKGSGSERVVHSMTRLARNPATLYSYYNTCEGELLRLVPKFPYFFYEGTLSPEMLLMLQKSYDEPVAGIAVKAVLDGVTSNGPLGFPQRAPYDPPFVALQAGKESARQGIRAAMGLIPLPTNAGKLNDKSGVALKEIKDTGQQGAFHFVHAHNIMVEFIGVQCEDLFPKILKGVRDEAVMGEDMKPRTVKLNQQGEGEDILPSITGDHQVTVSVGPSDDSEREQAGEFVDTLVGSPEVLGLAGPEGAKKIAGKAIRLKNLGPIGDQIAEIYDPQEQDGEEQLPPQAQAMLAEAKQITEAAMAENQQLKQQLEGKQLEMQSRERIAAASDDTKKQIAALQDAQKREQADLQAATDIRLQQMEDTIKRMALALDAAKIQAGQQHDEQMAARGHAQSLEQGAQSHQQAVEMQDRQPVEAGE